MPSEIRSIAADEFLRRLHARSDDLDHRFAFFIGAGCSRSSGIPAAGELVQKQWLPRLRTLCDPYDSYDNINLWAKSRVPDYDPKRPAASYGDVMEQLFLHAGERQHEIERLCEGKFPRFGYATLAKLIAQEGGRFNVVLTTNFDDLIADAMYLFTDSRPLVIQHESLSEYIRPTRTRPLVVKVHGDHRLSPLNTLPETAELKAGINRAVQSLLHDRGLIFMGYGGGDQGILQMLSNLSVEALPFGVYWISRNEPEGSIREWLASRNAVWVEYDDFDRFMVLTRSIFNLPPPNKKRFEEVFNRYADDYKKLADEIMELPDTVGATSALKDATRRTDEIFEGPWAVFIEASRIKDNDPDKAESLYKEGIDAFPDSVPLLGSYADFLKNVRQDHDGAEEYYCRALEANPDNVTTLGNYANFLTDMRQDFDRAEEYYRRALEIDASRANVLGSYAIFLTEVRQDHGAAEEYYRQALEIDPSNANILGSYAIFLKNVRQNHDAAEEYYRRALEADPSNANILGSYAEFLTEVRQDSDRTEEYYRRALEIDPSRANTLGNYAGYLLAEGRHDVGLECLKRALPLAEEKQALPLLAELWFYFFAHHLSVDHQRAALCSLKQLLESGVRSPGWGLSRNVERARINAHPEIDWLDPLAKVIGGTTAISVLDDWSTWQHACAGNEDSDSEAG